MQTTEIQWTADGFRLQQTQMEEVSLDVWTEPSDHTSANPGSNPLETDTGPDQTNQVKADADQPSSWTEAELLQAPLDPAQEIFWQALDQYPGDTLYRLGYMTRLSGSANLKYLWTIARQFIQNLAMDHTLEAAREQTQVPLPQEDADRLLTMVPFGHGTQYIQANWLTKIWALLQAGFVRDAQGWGDSMVALLKSHQPQLEPAQRVYFHLIENPGQEQSDYPFAFMATYAVKTPEGSIRHVPLSHVFQEFDKGDPRLLTMLTALSKAAAISPLLDDLLVSGEIFHPLRLDGQEAWELLKVVEPLEAIGICSRIPNWWKKRTASASLSVTLGKKKASLLGMDTLLTMKPSLIIQGRELTRQEIKELLAMDEGLHMLKGGWVEVNHKRLKELLDTMEQYEGTVTLSQALHLSAGLESGEEPDDALPVEIHQSAWLSKMINQLRQPATLRKQALARSIQATLRPYQKDGVKWLSQLGTLGFGACLADDMGLGKTLQLLAYLETWRQKQPEAKVLLVAPASLLGNWEKELLRFTPKMPYQILHSSQKGFQEMQEAEPPFLTITTYKMISQIPSVQERTWDAFVLDEAQAIKNAGTRQTKTVKSIHAHRKIALTGTPVENDLGNLWSLFDFLNPGLLGTRKEFGTFVKTLDDHPENYSRLKQMLSPFLLRRLKTDPAIAPDLPEKVEKTEYIPLTRKQTALYHQVVNQLEKELEEAKAEGIQRKGLILRTITQLKQVCNHPDQYNGQTAYAKQDSGKLVYLEELCTKIQEQHECVLVFTQFAEIVPQLDAFLRQVFGAPGMTIVGSTPVPVRTQLTERFNAQKEYIPYMVLSLRAAGVGLNLVAANHVIHFDRWWNPAAENQATDRAYRIGQHNNVVVHKFVSKDTIEEKIDQMIESKKELAEKVVEAKSGSEAAWLTEMSNEDLLQLLRGGLS